MVVGQSGNDEALVRLAVGPLRSHLLSFFPKELDRGVKIAIRFLKRLLAVHHADACHIAEPLDVLC